MELSSTILVSQMTPGFLQSVLGIDNVVFISIISFSMVISMAIALGIEILGMRKTGKINASLEK